MKDYKDIFGWFPEESAEALSKIIEQYGITTVLEIGCLLGKSTVFFASKGMSVTVVDPFVLWHEKDKEDNGDMIREGGEKFLDKFKENTKDYEESILTLIGTSKGISDKNMLENHGLVYIDALHDYESVKEDIQLWDKKASRIVCGDDYDENWPGVKQAVDEIYGDRVKIIGRFWYVVKD